MWIRRASVVVVFLLFGHPAWAGKILVTPLIQGDTGDTINCGVSNAGKKDLHLKIELLNGGGSVLVNTDDLAIGAGTANRIQTQLNSSGTNHFVFCRFTVLSGSAGSVRASLCLLPAGSARCAVSADAR